MKNEYPEAVDEYSEAAIGYSEGIDGYSEATIGYSEGIRGRKLWGEGRDLQGLLHVRIRRYKSED